MKNNREEINPDKTARVAAFVFLIIFCLGVSAELFIRPDIIVPGDAARTVNNIMASESLFRLSLVSELIRQIFIMLLSLILYKLLKPVNKNIASLMVIFALVGVSISMLNELNHFAALLLSSGADYLKAFGADQLQALVMFFLDLRKYGTSIPQVFSLWVLFLGYLVFKSGFLPKILGVVLMIHCFSWLMYFSLFFLSPDYDVTTNLSFLLGFIAEFGLTLWLLIKGIKDQKPVLIEEPEIKMTAIK